MLLSRFRALPFAFSLFAFFMFAFASVANATITVRIQTNVGAIDIDLYDTTAPRTVANFMGYLNSGRYKESFIHRSVPGFVIQGGGYTWDMPQNVINFVPAFPAIVNEFSSSRPNVRGSIAMAKLGGDPNSATSEWFINLADNPDLNTQNGGFTVFGQVKASSMAVVDAIGTLPLVNAGSPFDSLPISSAPSNNTIQKSNVVVVSSVTNLSSPYQGMWWNPGESGWGMSVTQHGTTIFTALYTYDENGAPIWYSMNNCPLTGGNRCTADMYSVQGPTPPTVPWSSAGAQITKVGTGTLVFTDNNNATFSYTINNVTSSRVITRQIFATGPNPPAADYTDLWWNANESGWGVTITQQFGIIFAAWFVYDDNRKPMWYVALNCPITANTCTSDLHRASGGVRLTAPWNGAVPTPTKVGDVTFTFSDAANGVMRYTLNGVTTSRAITRQPF
jgi:cyclophilin family peptidyl-prolyl cis-trans isomerase